MAEQRFTKEDMKKMMGQGSMEVNSIKVKTSEGDLEDFEEIIISFGLPSSENDENKGKIGGMFG